MTLAGLHHVAVICSDYARSRAFYVDILGLTILAETYRADRDSHKLDLLLPDGTQIELFSFPSAPSRLSYPEACGLRHLAFRVTDLDREIAELIGRAISVEPTRIDPLTGCRFTFSPIQMGCRSNSTKTPISRIPDPARSGRDPSARFPVFSK